ncbi:MAG: polynucleotide adenylyltransferase PcnB [Neisseriaceae bacterium]|nr:polynucleotide adenylyltransferase PcnB [Neisseriaceae bacterium]
MIKRMIKKILHKTNSHKTQKLDKTQHTLRSNMLSSAAKKTVTLLHQAGYEAYIVGGAVRDLLLERRPKDFDVATNATPDEIRKVFKKRSRIIGKRFPIVHVFVGREIVEVTTFRGNTDNHNEHGRIMRDATFGTRQTDAQRRDFTCNALYYDPITESIFDDVGALKDIHNHQLVMIGNPTERFREDPMRILRAVRLSSKLDFEITTDIKDAILTHSHLLKSEPAARIFDEISKEILCGQANKCFLQLEELGIPADTHPIFEITNNARQSAGKQFLHTVLIKTDERIKQDKPVAVAFVLAALMWSEVEKQQQQNMAQEMPPSPAMQTAIKQVIRNNESNWGMPRRLLSMMRDIWHLQPQLEIIKGKRPLRLLSQPSFRAAYDFYLLRSQCNNASEEKAQWWTYFQKASSEEREKMLFPPQEQLPKKTKKRTRRKKKTTTQTEQTT